MVTDFKIKEIHFKEAIILRQKVMYPNKSLVDLELPNDKEGTHFGLFVDDRLVSVISVFITDNELQFRKFATLNECQGKGYGSKLLTHVFNIAKQEKYQRVWCNARANKAGFYHKFGMKETNTHFTKDGFDFIVMERFL